MHLRHSWLCAVILVAVSSACELSEVVVPLGEPVVVVHAVMRPDLPQQFVVVEHSFTGVVEHEWLVDATIPSGGSPADPVEGAVVEVRNLDFAADPCGEWVRFKGEPEADLLPELAGVYWSPPSCPGMRAGDRLELRLEAPDGVVVEGTTRVPAMDYATLLMAGDSLRFGSDSVIIFNRDRDTLRVGITPVAGRLVQIEVLRSVLDMVRGDCLEPGTKILADTTSLSLPGDVVDVFERGDGCDVFRAGRNYVVSVALTDSNYFDFTRSRNNEFTGRGFINRLSGGIGVFGSLVATSARVRAIGDVDDPREGVYRLQGEVQGIDVDALLTVYLARSVDTTEFSAFLDGAWFTLGGGPEGTVAWVPLELDRKSLDGWYSGGRLFAVLVQPAAHAPMRVVLRASWSPDAPFDVTVADSAGIASHPLGTVTASQQ